MKITEEMLYKSAEKAEELWLDTFPSDDELPKHKFSKRFERKMKKLRQTQRRSPALNRFISISKRIAVIALAILTVSFSCLMCVEAYREKFIQVITEIFEDLTQYSFSSSHAEKTEFSEITFDYLPEGMTEVHREHNPKTHSQSIYFEDAEGRRILVDIDIMSNDKQSTTILDTENADVSTTDINGHEATLIEKNEYTTLMWDDSIFIILVSGNLPSEEIIKLASEIKICGK